MGVRRRGALRRPSFSQFPGLDLVLYGIALIAVTIFYPAGFAGLVAGLRRFAPPAPRPAAQALEAPDHAAIQTGADGDPARLLPASGKPKGEIAR